MIIYKKKSIQIRLVFAVIRFVTRQVTVWIISHSEKNPDMVSLDVDSILYMMSVFITFTTGQSEGKKAVVVTDPELA